jgi:fibronectin type 3 domain-containing protein
MLKMKRNILLRFAIIASVVFSSRAIIAQIPEPPSQKAPDVTVSLIGKSFGDSIVLRLAPTSIDSWLRGNAFGYDIFRYRVVTGQHVVDKPVKELLTSQPLKPMKLEDIESIYGRDKYAAIVAQAIYGSSFNLNTHGENYNFLNMSSELSNRYSFALFACDMSIAAAKSHGLIFTDRNVEKDAKYVYSVKPHWRDTLSLADSALIFIAVADTYSVPPPIQVYTRFEDKTVEISWDRISTEHLFSAFIVERSSDGGRTFGQVNKNPLMNAVAEEESKVRRFMYVDTVPEYDREYFYRVRGITPFGELSQPSKVVSGKGKEILVGVNPMIVGSEKKEDGSVYVKWDFPEDYQGEIKGFIVEHSETAGGLFNRISDTLNSNVRSFRDIAPMDVNYYQVCAISLSGYDYCSFPSLVELPDSIPPAVPSGLEGTIDTLGIVTLTWHSNSEKDFMSYKIYRSNHPIQDFVQINNIEIRSPSFTDTVPLNNLSGKVYYAISAQDKHYNESGQCEPLKIVKPDTIPPVSPKIINYRAGMNTVEIEWIPSSSEDVVKHLIYRRISGNNEWKLLDIDQSQLSEPVTYTDSLLSNGVDYEYLILAVDETGLESQNNQSLKVRTGIPPGRSISQVTLRLNASDDGKSILIKWTGKTSGISKLLLYKSVDNEKFALFRSVLPDQKQLSDETVKTGHTYRYCIQAIDSRGIRMKISEPYTVTL